MKHVGKNAYPSDPSASNQGPKRRRVLVADDDRATCTLLENILSRDYDVACADSGEMAIAVTENFMPDLALLDIVMPDIDGHQLCRHLKSTRIGRDLQIIMVTAHTDSENYLEAFKSGADGYISKPIDHDELRLKIGRHFRLQDTRLKIMTNHWTDDWSYKSAFERQVAKRSGQLLANDNLSLCTLEILANSVEPDEGERLVRMRFLTPLLAAELKREPAYRILIDTQTIKDLYHSTPLHDLGKIGISRYVLSKDTPLTADESNQMRLHTTIGGVLLEQAWRNTKNSDYLTMAAVLARCHHERFDGTGYPLGLAREAIPLPARIIALAQVYITLTSLSLAEGGHSPEEARNLIKGESGRHFDPGVVAAFEACFDDIVRVQRQLDASVLAGAMSFLD